MPEDPRSFLPLKQVEFLILVALSERDQHGYGLVREVAERTDGVVTLEPGNLYRVVRRLLDHGLVSESDRRPADDNNDERRRYYHLTTLGARVAAAEGLRLQRVLASPSVKALTRKWATES